MKLVGIIKQILKENLEATKPMIDLEFNRDILPNDSVPSGAGTRSRIQDIQDFESWKSTMIDRWGEKLLFTINRKPGLDRIYALVIPDSPNPENREYHAASRRSGEEISKTYYGKSGAYTGD